MAARLAVLADADITETEQSSAALLELEVSVPELADLLTGHLLRELVVRGARGGPLAPLADQLNHDVTHLQGQQHSASLAAGRRPAGRPRGAKGTAGSASFATAPC